MGSRALKGMVKTKVFTKSKGKPMRGFTRRSATITFVKAEMVVVSYAPKSSSKALEVRQGVWNSLLLTAL